MNPEPYYIGHSGLGSPNGPISFGFRPTRLSTLLDIAPTPSQNATDDETQILSVPIKLRRAGREITMLIDRADPFATAKPDAQLLKLLIRARRFNATLVGSDGVPFAALAKREGVSPSYFTRLVRLSYLAPDITQAILDGRQPRDLRYLIDFIMVIFHPIRCHRSETVLNGRGVDLAHGPPAATAVGMTLIATLYRVGGRNIRPIRAIRWALCSTHRREGRFCEVALQYPAPGIGKWIVRCDVCAILALLTAAGGFARKRRRCTKMPELAQKCQAAILMNSFNCRLLIFRRSSHSKSS
jgi:hypothetical protein